MQNSSALFLEGHLLMYTFFQLETWIKDANPDIEDMQTATKTEVCPNGHCNYNFCSHKTHPCLTTLHFFQNQT